MEGLVAPLEARAALAPSWLPLPEPLPIWERMPHTLNPTNLAEIIRVTRRYQASQKGENPINPLGRAMREELSKLYERILQRN